MANPLLDALLADREGNSASGFSPMSAPTPAAGARMIDFATPLPEMTPDAASSESTLAFPEEVDQTYTPLDAPEPAETSAEIAPAPRANPLLAALKADQAATQQAVAEAATPDDRLPVIRPELADALGVLDYRDPQEGQRRQQAAAVGEILNLPMFERVNLGAAPVNADGTVTIRRAQAVSPEAQAAADARMANIRTMAAGEMLVEESPKEVGTLQGIANAAQNAFDSARQALMATDGLDANDASEIASIEYNKAARRVAPGYAAYQQAEGWDAAKAFAKNPFEVTTNIITEGLAGSWPALAGGLATGATTAAVTGVAGSVVPGVGNVIGAGGGFTAGMIGGTGAGSFATEYGGKILEELQTAGMNPKDPESIANFFSNETLMAKAKDAALKRGVPVAAFDALSAGIAGRVGSVFRAAAKTPVRLAVTEAAIQGGLGGAGEVAGSVAAGDPVNPKAVFGEVIGEVGPAAIEIAAGRAASAAPAEVPQNFTPISSPAPAPGPVAPAPAPQNLGQVRAPEIPIDQAALDEAFGSPFAPPQPAPADPFAPSPEASAPQRPALSFSTDAITPEQTALATDFSNRLTGQLRTQGILDTASTLDLTPVNLDRVDAGAPLADFIDNFSRLTGTRIQFVKASDPTIFGGAVRSDDAQTIYLNADSQRPVASLIGHEYGHTLQYSNPALYKDLRRVVATYTDSYRTRARESAAAPIYRTGPATQRVRTQTAELTNNTLGDAFLDPEFWRSVQNENRPLLQKLWTSFNEWVDSLLTRQSQATWGTPQFATDLTALRRDLAKTIAPALRPPTRSFGNAQITAKPGVIDLAIEAYHGTPHKVDRFTTEKIGSGEGAQAYGWGLYFAENRSVATDYKNQLERVRFEVDGEPYDTRKSAHRASDALNKSRNDRAKAIAALETQAQNEEKFLREMGAWDYEGATKFFVLRDREAAQMLRDGYTPETKQIGTGNLYTVELDVEPEDLLDWDKPLSEQSEKVKAAVDHVKVPGVPFKEVFRHGHNSGSIIYETLIRRLPGVSGPKAASEYLSRLGIRGIRYLDQGSRAFQVVLSTKQGEYARNSFDTQTAAESYAAEKQAEGFTTEIKREGTYNYVVFDENLIKITAQNGQPVSREIAFASEHKPRKFTQSVQAAPGVAPEVKAQLTALDYDPISNAQTVASARARIDAAGSMDSAVTQFMGNAANPDFQPTAVDYATGIELLGQLQSRGRHEDAAAIADFMARAGTTQGQAIQALSLISRLTPAGIEAFASRQITRAARNDPKIEELIQDNQRLRAEIAAAKRDSATAAIVDNRAAIKAALPAGADAVATNIAIREAILQSPTPLAAQAATARILQDNGLSEKSAIRIAQSITKDFLKTTTESRAKVLQDLLALAEKDRRFNKSKIGSLIRLNREGKLTDSRLHADMAKMLGIPAWTPEHSAKVQGLLRQREAATDPRIKLVKAAEALDVIYRESMPAGMLAKIDTFQTLMMLLNPKTWIRNIGGNAFMFGADLSADTVAWGADAAVSIVTGNRTRTGLDLATRFSELGAGLGDIQAGYEFARTQGMGRLGSFKEGVQTLIRLGRLYSSKKYDSAEITGFTGTTFQSGIGKVLEDTLGAALTLVDRGFYQSAFRASLDNQMRLAAQDGPPLAAPTPDMIAQARMDASRAVYQDENAASRTLSGLRRVLNANQRWGLGSMLMKFTQVPGSILMRGIEFSPLGFIRNAYELLAPALSNRVDFNQKAFTEQFSRALVGTTGLVATGYWLAQLGIISAGRENEDEKKRNLAKAEGWGSYKLNVSALKRALITGNFWTRQPRQNGDVVVNYDWAQPLSISVAMGAYAKENQKAVQEDILRGKKQSLLATGFNWMSAAAASATGAMNALVEQPLLSGLSTFFRNAAYDDIPGAILAAASDVPKSLMPTAARQWMQLDDNTVRETRDSSPFRQYVNELKSQLPGLSQTLPAKRDILGEDVERYQRHSNTVFNVLFNPSMVTYIKKSPLLAEMSQVYEMTGNPSVIPNQAGRDFTIEGVKVRLTTEEISALQKDMGALSVAAVEKFVLDDPRYDKATWDIKAKAFTRALEKAATAAKYRILLSRPDLKQRAQIEHQQTIQRRQEMQQMMDSGVGAALMQ